MAVYPFPFRCGLGRTVATPPRPGGEPPAAPVDLSLLLHVLNPATTPEEEAVLRCLALLRGERPLQPPRIPSVAPAW